MIAALLAGALALFVCFSAGVAEMVPVATMWVSCVAMVLVAGLFVASMYVPWIPQAQNGPTAKSRNHPRVIANRTVGASVAAAVALYAATQWEKVAVRELEPCLLLDGDARPLSALLAATLHFALLFFGPLAGIVLFRQWNHYLQDIGLNLYTFREIIFSPAVEEIVFRYAGLRVLAAGGWGYWSAAVLSAGCFGLAHSHHMWEHITIEKKPIFRVLVHTALHVLITIIFGLYSAQMLYSSRSLIACVLLHALCNIIGIPNVSLPMKNRFVLLAYIVGLLSYCYVCVL